MQRKLSWPKMIRKPCELSESPNKIKTESGSEPETSRKPKSLSEPCVIRKPLRLSEPGQVINTIIQSETTKTKGEKTMMTKDERATLKMYVKARMSFQDIRKAMDNRVGRKADGTDQDIADRNFEVEDFKNFVKIADSARGQEDFIEKELQKKLNDIPFYRDWLKNVKGVGPISAAWILGCFDIETATTASKLHAYAGLSPGMVRGQIRVKPKEYKESQGRIIKIFMDKKGKPETYIVETDKLVRADRRTKGFQIPFNAPLKTALMGLLAKQFMLKCNPYRKFYDDRKNRKRNSEGRVVSDDENNKRKDDWALWSEVSKGHLDSDAKRYMIKMFLIDLYAAWREYEGLPVREPYAAEYLGKKHEQKISRTSQ